MNDVNQATGLAAGTFGVALLETDGRRFAAIVRPNGSVIDVSATFPDIVDVYADWPRSFDRLIDLEARGTPLDRPFGDYHALAPVDRPQVLGGGSNYRQHVAEMYTHNKMNQHNRLPGETDEAFFQRNLKLVDERRLKGIPFFWTGLHSSLIGANDDIVLPPIGSQHDWEAELCCIVAGGAGRFMTPDEADGFIAGYMVGNDYGTIDQFRRTDVNWGNDFISKHAPTFKTLGPFFVPKPFVTLGDDVRIEFRINGEVRQDWPVSDMIFSPGQFIAYASERIRLLPGDVLFTGSPPGNGASFNQFMHPGDVVETAITYLGRQRNRVIAEDLGGRSPHFGDFPTK